MLRKPKVSQLQRRKKRDQGFTLVEVMIAGVIMSTIMVSVAQMTGKAMVGGHRQKNRQAIEAAINDDIQVLQQTDSKISIQWIKEEGDFINACENPGEYLANLLKVGGKFYVAPRNADESNNESSTDEKTEETGLFRREIMSKGLPSSNNSGGADSTISNPTKQLLTRVVYTFQGPEKAINEEKRVVELSPSFQAFCYQ